MIASAELRERLRDEMYGTTCPCCGHQSRKISARTVATQAGIDNATVSAFLRGRVSAGATLDAVAGWLAGRA